MTAFIDWFLGTRPDETPTKLELELIPRLPNVLSRYCDSPEIKLLQAEQQFCLEVEFAEALAWDQEEAKEARDFIPTVELQHGKSGDFLLVSYKGGEIDVLVSAIESIEATPGHQLFVGWFYGARLETGIASITVKTYSGRQLSIQISRHKVDRMLQEIRRVWRAAR